MIDLHVDYEALPLDQLATVVGAVQRLVASGWRKAAEELRVEQLSRRPVLNTIDIRTGHSIDISTVLAVSSELVTLLLAARELAPFALRSAGTAVEGARGAIHDMAVAVAVSTAPLPLPQDALGRLQPLVPANRELAQPLLPRRPVLPRLAAVQDDPPTQVDDQANVARQRRPNRTREAILGDEAARLARTASDFGIRLAITTRRGDKIELDGRR